MKKLTLILLFVLFGQTSQGWIIGLKYGSTAIAYSEWGECQKYEGESRPCTSSDIALMVSVSKLYLK